MISKTILHYKLAKHLKDISYSYHGVRVRTFSFYFFNFGCSFRNSSALWKKNIKSRCNIIFGLFSPEILNALMIFQLKLMIYHKYTPAELVSLVVLEEVEVRWKLTESQRKKSLAFVNKVLVFLPVYYLDSLSCYFKGCEFILRVDVWRHPLTGPFIRYTCTSNAMKYSSSVTDSTFTSIQLFFVVVTVTKERNSDLVKVEFIAQLLFWVAQVTT